MVPLVPFFTRSKLKLGQRRRQRRATTRSPGRAASSSRINPPTTIRSEEHTSELQSLMRISYAVFCLKKKNIPTNAHKTTRENAIIIPHKIQQRTATHT